ncbi:MAG TPA: hypothetical protein VJ867_10065 [Gemmatimonadaceae bacterium]|nr:hypothetical protein [Gemmatimonadaceae bacterium]
MRGYAEYIASCVLIVAIITALAATLISGSAIRIVLTGGLVALAVQLASFTIARVLRARNMLLGWGLGSALRLIALVIYAILVAKLWRAALTPALLSFAAFLFVTTVVEPVFLKR